MAGNILATAQQYRKEPKPEMEQGRMLTPEVIVGRLFYYHNCSHFYHLQTTSFAQHKMLGKLYEGLVDSKDSIAEYLLGAQAPQRLGNVTIEPLMPYSPEAVSGLLDNGCAFSLSLYQYAESKNLTQLCNMASDLEGLFISSKYLNTLS